MFTPWIIALIIALILIQAARRERRQVANFTWSSPENVQSKTWAYGLAFGALVFVLAAVILASLG